MKSYYIHLIRHGQTEANIDGRYIGHTDLPLCEDGEMQLMKLRDAYIYPRASVVLSSPLARCTQTAQMIYPDLEPLIISDLIEYNFGEFEGKTAEELRNHPVFADWLAGKQDVEPPFGESHREFSARILGCFVSIVEGLMKTGTVNAAVITHGGVLTAIMAAFALPEAPMHEWISPNGCGYTVRITPSLWMRGQKMEAVRIIPYSEEDTVDSDDEQE